MNEPTNSEPAALSRMPFVVEFIKFAAAFATILATSLIVLHVAIAAQ